MNQTSAEGPRTGCAADLSRKFTVTLFLLLDESKMETSLTVLGEQTDPVVPTE